MVRATATATAAAIDTDIDGDIGTAAFAECRHAAGPGAKLAIGRCNGPCRQPAHGRRVWCIAQGVGHVGGVVTWHQPDGVCRAARGDWGLRMDDQWIDTLAQAGFRSVRLSVRWSNHAAASPDALLDEAFARRIDRVVDALLARDLRVVMNMSFYSQLSGWPLDEGEAPVAARVVRTRFINIWRQLARRHAHRSDRLVFELYNAPQGPPQQWNSLAAAALAGIRQSNPVRIVVIAPLRNEASHLADLSLPRDPHLVVAIHNREPRTFTNQGLPWFAGSDKWLGTHCCDEAQRVSLERNLDLAKAWSDAHRYPLWLGSFGAASTAPMESRARYLRLMREAAEARGMAWAHADFAANFNVRDPPLDSGIYDVVKRQWHRPLLDALLGP